MRFFYLTVLNKPWPGHEMPYPKKSMHLPVIWSPDDVARFIDAPPTQFCRTIVTTLYATGMRQAQVAALNITLDRNNAELDVLIRKFSTREDFS